MASDEEILAAELDLDFTEGMNSETAEVATEILQTTESLDFIEAEETEMTGILEAVDTQEETSEENLASSDHESEPETTV